MRANWVRSKLSKLIYSDVDYRHKRGNKVINGLVSAIMYTYNGNPV